MKTVNHTFDETYIRWIAKDEGITKTLSMKIMKKAHKWACSPMNENFNYERDLREYFRTITF